MVYSLPVIHIIAPTPFALEVGLTLTHGRGIVEVPGSVALLLCSWRLWGAIAIGIGIVTIVACLLGFGLSFQLCIALLLFLLLQSVNHSVDSLVAVGLGHLRQFQQRILQVDSLCVWC